MEPDSEDDLWRSIVEHYGDRVSLDPEDSVVDPFVDPVVDPVPDFVADPVADFVVDPVPAPPDEDAVRRDGDEERFVPPPPPPLPRVAPDRLLAWTGVFGTPLVLLTAVVTGIHLPGWLGYLLVGAFVGGFVYLVSRMPRGPRDPADDGARL